jgi:hypothetical protein
LAAVLSAAAAAGGGLSVVVGDDDDATTVAAVSVRRSEDGDDVGEPELPLPVPLMLRLDLRMLDGEAGAETLSALEHTLWVRALPTESQPYQPR